jgi:hypothetical protein
LDPEKTYEALFTTEVLRMQASGLSKERLDAMGAGAILMGAFLETFPCVTEGGRKK